MKLTVKGAEQEDVGLPEKEAIGAATVVTVLIMLLEHPLASVMIRETGILVPTVE